MLVHITSNHGALDTNGEHPATTLTEGHPGREVTWRAGPGLGGIYPRAFLIFSSKARGYLTHSESLDTEMFSRWIMWVVLAQHRDMIY